MEKLTKLIKKADFVGLEIKPTLNGSNRIKSILGGFISIIAMICVLFGFIYFGLSMVKRDKPIMNVVREMKTEVLVPIEDNPFLIAVYDRMGRPIHNNPEFKRAVNIQAEMQKTRPDGNRGFQVESYTTNLIECEYAEVSQTIRDQFNKAGFSLKHGLCQDNASFLNSKGESYKDKVYLKNRYAEQNSNYIHYKFIHCDEQADPGCGAYLKSIGRVVVLFYKLNYYIDPTDYLNPVKFDLNQSAYSISETVSQTVYVGTKINEIITDSSLFLTEEVKETFFSMMSPTMSVGPFEPKERLLLEFVTHLERVVEINQRSYLKIPELLANMGGFLKASLMIGNLVSYFYSEYVFFVTVRQIEAERKDKLVSNKKLLTLSSEGEITKNEADDKKVKVELPSFWEYFGSFFSQTERKEMSKRHALKYLEFNYLIDSLAFVEELKKQREADNSKPIK